MLSMQTVKKLDKQLLYASFAVGCTVPVLPYTVFDIHSFC